MISMYCIEIRGLVSLLQLEIYREEFTITYGEDATFMTGLIQDASHLHGIVSHLTSLGLELVEVRRARPSSSRFVKARDN